MAKDKIKILEKKLKALRSKPDKGASARKKVDVLNDLAFALCTSDPQKTEDYARQALVLAEKLDYKKGIVGSYQVLGSSYHTRCDYDKATAYFLESLKISKEIRDKKGIAASYNSIGLTNGRRGDYAQALKHFFKALKIREEIGDKKEIALTYNNIGITYGKRGDYEQALEYFFKALRVFEEIRDKAGIALCYGNIGIIYDDQGDYEQALKYHHKALKTHKETGAKINIAHNYTNIGIIYERQGRYEQALKHHHKALKIREEIGDKAGIAAAFDNIGVIYEKQSDYEHALEYHLKALKIQEEIGDRASTARSYIHTGRVHTKLKHYDLALSYLQKSLQLAQETGTKDVEIEGYKNFSEMYEAQQNYEQALSYYKKYTDIEKEVFNTEKSKQIADMKTKYETERKEKEAEIYHLKNVKLRKEIKERKKVEKELKKHRDHLGKLVEERTAQLRSLAHELSLVEEKQRRKIATYLHDDIAQALALATVKLELLQEMASTNNIRKELEETKEIIDQTTARTRSLTFEISPPVLYDSGIEPAVEWLAEQFQKQHEIVCEFKSDGLPKPARGDMKVILFQSVRELLTNVAKHAQARSVRVSTMRDGNIIRIEVEDDGVGFDPKILDQKITKNEGFGLFNLRERLRHLRGKLEVSSIVGQGTSVAVTAPLKSSQRGMNKRKR